MASAVSSGNISEEERRWAVVGICLTKVLTPVLRNVVKTELGKWHHGLCQPPVEIDKQVFTRHKKNLAPSKYTLQYQNINNNTVHKLAKNYDYAVRNPLSLTKLFVQPFMAHFTGFDQTMDLSAILAVMIEADPFVSCGAAAEAKNVRSDIRNEWAHCNFSKWTEAKFNDSFQGMMSLIKKINLPSADKNDLRDELISWKDKGLKLCFGQPVDSELLKLVMDGLAELRASVETWKCESDAQEQKLLTHLGNIQSNLKEQSRELDCRIKKCESLGAENSKELKLLNEKFSTAVLSKYHHKQEGNIPYVFNAPPRNEYFSGRIQELEELEHVLKPDDASQEKKSGMAAVCGLGGIGKTSLVTEHAHVWKDYYQGGVYWFSAENDEVFEQDVNDTARQVFGALLNTFDSTLSNTLIKIGQTSKPSLIVLDCLDQLDLSRSIRRFLDLVSRRSVSAAVVIVTRRKKTLLVEEIPGLQEERCLTLKCLDVEEAKQFLFKRTGLSRDENTNSVADDLAEQLGGLPLALEQAAACIRTRGYSFPDYLERYKIEHLKLLKRQKARSVSVNESRERLAVHTTWLLNISHIQDSEHGMFAIRLMNAFTFLNPNEIEQELVNVGEPEIEDKKFRDCVSSDRLEVVKLLTDFSLFMTVHGNSISTHRLVQELVKENLKPEEKAKSFVDAVRLLSFAFSKCKSPNDLLRNVGIEERLKTFAFPGDPSQYYQWSKLCFHGFYLQHNMEKLLENPEPDCLNSLFTFETTKVLYQCVVHRSAHLKQVEAKRTLNLAYRILDWVPLREYDTAERRLSGNSLFPSHVIPLPKWFQIAIKQSCVPPVNNLEALPGRRAASEDSDSCELVQEVENLKSKGNDSYKGGNFQEAVDAYSAAINKSRGTPAFDPLLLTNRASAYIKLNQRDSALKDANEYILRYPECWKGYARKALALDEVGAEIAAALAYYYCLRKDGSCIFSKFPPFKNAFPGLKERICICTTGLQLIDELMEEIPPRDTPLRIIILGSNEYILNLDVVKASTCPCLPGQVITPIYMTNSIMVGAKLDGTVNIKLEGTIGLHLLKNVMFANLSFSIDKGEIHTFPESCVKVLNCNFTSNNTRVTFGVAGVLNAERCKFTSYKSVGLLCSENGEMVVDDCTFASCRKCGLEVRGKLTVRNSRMYNNGLDGLRIGPKAAKCDVFDCHIYHNVGAGIAVVNDTKCIKLMRCRIFGNDQNGICVKFYSDVDVRENTIFDNELWGIWSGDFSCCRVSMNHVSGNKRGGVRIGKVPAIEGLPYSVVELNTIHDNYGPGYVNNFYGPLPGSYSVNDPSQTCAAYKSAEFHENNVVYGNEESVIVNKSKLPSYWCSQCFRKCEKLERCGKCFAAVYCNTKCERSHSQKHEKLCKVLRENSSFVITSMERHGCDGLINIHAKGLDEIGPKYGTPPPRDGQRFIVKVQTRLDRIADGQRHVLRLYDRSLHVDEIFQSEFIEHIVKEFGLLCQMKYQEKKLFFYCVFEKNGKLRLFINDFADFQTW